MLHGEGFLQQLNVVEALFHVAFEACQEEAYDGIIHVESIFFVVPLIDGSLEVRSRAGEVIEAFFYRNDLTFVLFYPGAFEDIFVLLGQSHR